MAVLSVTASQVIAGTDADFYQGIAGVAVTAGQAVYFDEMTNTLKLADANAAQDTAEVKGVSLHLASIGQPLRVITKGTLTIGAGAAPVLSTIYIASATAGGIEPAADLASADYTSIIGVGGATNTLKINIFNSHSLKA
jgi:hypothetical protein